MNDTIQVSNLTPKTSDNNGTLMLDNRVTATSKNYLAICLKRLISVFGTSGEMNLPEIDYELLTAVADYIRWRSKGRLTDSETCSLISDGLQKVHEHLKKPDVNVKSPARFFRTTVKNLLLDMLERDGGPDRYLISESRLRQLEESGIPAKILHDLLPETSISPVSYRSLLDKLNALFFEGSIAAKSAARYRRILKDALRYSEKAENYEAEMGITSDLSDQEAHTDHQQIWECLNKLDQRDRDLIKLRHQLYPELSDFTYSFEDLQSVFGFESVRQTQNRYYYVWDQLRKCLKAVGQY